MIHLIDWEIEWDMNKQQFDFSDCHFMDTDNHEYKAVQSLLISLTKELALSKNEKEIIKSYNNVLKCLLNQFYKGKENDY